jgi:3-methyladenine DNA glycosylase AlkD
MTFDARQAAEDLAAELRKLGTPERAAQEKKYLKSDLEFYGVSVPDMRRAVKATVHRETGIALAIALWEVPVFERRAAAVETLEIVVMAMKVNDLELVERMIRESGTWALVDGLAGSVAGKIADREPAAWARIDGWAQDEDFWVRRSALLALLAGIRAGRPDLERFERYATPMIGETQFFIRKAIGWVLREISRRDPAWVAAWTGAHLDTMSGVTFREAVRRLPANDAERLTEARAALGAPRRAGAGRQR